MKHWTCSLVVALVFGMASPVLSTSRADAEALFEGVMVAAPIGDDQVLYRIEIPTGAVVKIDAAQITKIQDSAPLPAGDYHLFLSEAPDLKTYWLYRMDKATGRVWFLRGHDLDRKRRSRGIDDIEAMKPADVDVARRFHQLFQFRQGGGGRDLRRP